MTPKQAEVEKMAKRLYAASWAVSRPDLTFATAGEGEKAMFTRLARYVLRLLASERKETIAGAIRKIGALRHRDNIMQILEGMARERKAAAK